MSDDLPQLTRLLMTVHESNSGARSLTVSFLVNARDLLRGDFEEAAHDAVLRHAHAKGHMPIGPILVRTEPAKYEQPKVVEGKPMMRSMEDAQLDIAIQQGNIVQVMADVELGLSL